MSRPVGIASLLDHVSRYQHFLRRLPRMSAKTRLSRTGLLISQSLAAIWMSDLDNPDHPSSERRRSWLASSAIDFRSSRRCSIEA